MNQYPNTKPSHRRLARPLFFFFVYFDVRGAQNDIYMHLAIIKLPPHEVLLRRPVVTQPVLADPAQVVCVDVGRV